MTTIFQVEKVGPYGLKVEGELHATGKKAEIMDIARGLAETTAMRGTDARIDVLDNEGRLLRIGPFNADKYSDLPDEQRAHQEATEAAKAAVA